MANDLEHFGVKGMHWGVRKEEAFHPKYSSSLRSSDRASFGNGGVRRINKSMNEGKTHKEAAMAEYRVFLAKSALAIGVVGLGYALQSHGPTLARTISERAETNRGRAAMAAMKGLGAAESNQLFKKSRKGVYNITTLK